MQTNVGQFTFELIRDGRTMKLTITGRVYALVSDVTHADLARLGALALAGAQRGWREVLQLEGAPTLEHARRAYLQLAKQYSPDLTDGKAAELQELNAAWAAAQAEFAPLHF